MTGSDKKEKEKLKVYVYIFNGEHKLIYPDKTSIFLCFRYIILTWIYKNIPCKTNGKILTQFSYIFEEEKKKKNKDHITKKS